MEIYVIILGLLFVLALSDLVVGVGNDAVNFLNSAIGSKVAPRHIIMIVASLGVLVGTLFSSGMMEVARKGIFNPDMFYFNEVMVIFLAVMMTDVLLLDLFNTFGLPTSTTVSLVFELIGASVALSLIKISSTDGNFANIGQYINIGKAVAIVAGILLSVVVALVGSVTFQFLTRLIFSFNFTKRFKYLGAVWGSIALTGITYFILVKGSKGTSFLTKDTIKLIQDNAVNIIMGSFIIWTVVLQILISVVKLNILRGIVLVGTFALALAFAANDLVNFIGVPLAGYSSFLTAQNNPAPESLLMTALTEPVSTPLGFLMIAGAVMVLTLWFSKKARTVTKTEVNLGRQSDGYERFDSSMLSRAIVRMSVSFVKTIKNIVPERMQNFINRQFQPTELAIANDGERPSFDLLRAANNLMVASILISIGTSYKLPLSTTYVTFMVAMGTSLADRAWGRESAVYRVNGVITVIGGWFFTAFSAFISAFIMAYIIYYGEIYAIIGLVALAIFILLRTHIIHKQRTEEMDEDENVTLPLVTNQTEALNALTDEICNLLNSVPQIYSGTLLELENEDRNNLKIMRKSARQLRKKSNLITNHILKSIDHFKVEEIKAGKRFGKVITSVQEIANKLINITNITYNHIDNNHTTLSKEQTEELKQVCQLLSLEVEQAISIIQSKSFDKIDEYFNKQDDLVLQIAEYDNNQINRIKQNDDSARNSMLFLNVLNETENMSAHIGKLVNTLKNTSKSVTL